MRIRQLVLGAAVAAAAAGCSFSVGSSDLDTDSLQDEISSGIEEQTGVAVEVTCPDRPLEAGDVFDCTATADDGTEQAVTVTQEDAEGNVAWELGQ